MQHVLNSAFTLTHLLEQWMVLLRAWNFCRKEPVLKAFISKNNMKATPEGVSRQYQARTTAPTFSA